MIRYLLNFKTMTDVAVRTAILSLAIALLAATANQHVFAQFLPELRSQTVAIAFMGTFSIALLLSVPIMLVFFSTGLEISRLNEKLAILADIDHLTGLKNRRKFLRDISVPNAETGETVMRHRGSLLIIDVDHFKSINDRHGHQAGDEALVHISTLIRQSVRDIDSVARLGGEEFGVFLADTDRSLAEEIAERIRLNVNSTPLGLQSGIVTMSVSIGGTEVRPLQSLADRMRRADLLLYAAKSAGRNRVQFSEPVPAPSSVMAPQQRARVNARG